MAAERASAVAEALKPKRSGKKTYYHQPIRGVDVGDHFDGIYYLEQVFVREARNGNHFSDLMLRDASGSVVAKYWGILPKAQRGDFVHVEANVEEYAGQPSIVAAKVTQDERPEDLTNWVAMSDTYDEDIDKLDKFRDMVANLCQQADDTTPLRLLEEVLGRSSFLTKLIQAPGDVKPHYGRTGGLLACSVRAFEVTYRLMRPYGLTDREKSIALTAALLHRAGAVDAYGFVDCVPAETKQGILLGVAALTNSRLSSSLRRLVYADHKGTQEKPVSQDTSMRLLHAVLASGRVVPPMTKEALVLVEAVRSDERLVAAADFIAQDVNTEEEFTAYDPATKRRYLKS